MADLNTQHRQLRAAAQAEPDITLRGILNNMASNVSLLKRETRDEDRAAVRAQLAENLKLYERVKRRALARDHTR